LDFIAIKEAGGDLGTMAAQVRRGIAWVYKNAASFGGDPERIFIGGHSSGGHLCGVALVTDWQKDFGLPENTVKGGLCMSGMYEMAHSALCLPQASASSVY
jgi:arylformamidase